MSERNDSHDSGTPPGPPRGGSGVTDASGRRDIEMSATRAGSQEGGAEQTAPKTDDRFSRIFGLVVILIAFGVVGGWAATAPIDGAVVAPGTVTIDSYRKSVEHLEGGIVQTIHVRDGDIVEKGDLLVTLDDTQARASYLVNHNSLMANLAREARLEAEMDEADSIEFPERLVDSAEINPRSERALRNEQREFDARREALDGEISVLRQRLSQFEEQIKGLEAQREARLRSISSLEDELGSLSRLAEREMVPSSEKRPVERELAQAEGEAGELLASIATARIEAGETELQIIQRRREFERDVAAELRETSERIDELEEELQALHDTLRRTEIRAPVSGEVVDLQIHSEQGVISGGEPLLDLVPADENLILEARVAPEDIDSVDLGLEADVRFTAFSFRTTPVVSGNVIFVSADSLRDEDTGDRYFLTRVEVTEDEMEALGERHLRPGMPADVMIKTGERTPMQYLMQPLTDAVARAWTED